MNEKKKFDSQSKSIINQKKKFTCIKKKKVEQKTIHFFPIVFNAKKALINFQKRFYAESKYPSNTLFFKNIFFNEFDIFLNWNCLIIIPLSKWKDLPAKLIQSDTQLASINKNWGRVVTEEQIKNNRKVLIKRLLWTMMSKQ